MHNNSDQVESTRKEAMCGGMNVDGDDRLSRLPDDLIHKILSFVSIQEAIGTSFLSSRWRSIWTSIPYLNFSDENFSTRNLFSKFVLNVLSRLNHQIQVFSVKLIQSEFVSRHKIVKKAVKYAVSHNVQQLTVTCFPGETTFPLSVFNSKSLKHLTFCGVNIISDCTVTVSPTWELPALTTLHLDDITFSDDHDKCIGLFSKCPNLKNLSLRRCEIEGTNVFNIFHPSLSNLTLKETYSRVKVFNVVTPQLKNLTIMSCNGKYMISAPELTSLVFKGHDPLQLSTEGFPFLEKVDLFIWQQTLAEAHKMVCLLQQLHDVKFLTLNFKLLQLLCTSTELLNSHQPFALPNLKISKFSTYDTGMVYLEVATQEEVTMITELENHDTCPTAVFPMVSCEEIEVMSKLVLAQELVEELQELLKRCDRNSDHIKGCNRNTGKVKVKKQWVQSAFEMQWHFGEMMAQIEQGILDGLFTMELPVLETRHTISMLQCIEGLVTVLPASKRPALQLTFSSICEEAAILMNNMIYGMQKSGDSALNSFKET